MFNETSYPQTKFVTTVYFTIEYFRLKSLLSNLRIHCTVETLPVSLAIKSKLISNRSLIIPSRPMSNIHCIANMKCRFGIYIPPFRFWGRVKHFLHINADFACRGCVVKEDFTSRTRPYGLVEATVVS